MNTEITEETIQEFSPEAIIVATGSKLLKSSALKYMWQDQLSKQAMQWLQSKKDMMQQ